jgi:hypothetical protein
MIIEKDRFYTTPNSFKCLANRLSLRSGVMSNYNMRKISLKKTASRFPTSFSSVTLDTVKSAPFGASDKNIPSYGM